MRFNVKGVYTFKEKENPYTGIFATDGERIKGYISDPSSICERHEVEGTISHLENKLRIEFTKMPSSSLMAPIFYRFEKTTENGEIEGNYDGFWCFGEEEVIELCVGYKPGIGKALMIKDVEKGNNATITLSPES